MSELNMKDFVVCYGEAWPLPVSSVPGMTETSPVTFQGFSSDPLDVKTSTIGYPANHVEVSWTGVASLIESPLEFISILSHPWHLSGY